MQCDFNETLANQTAYLEWVIREQLVPSQEQYHGLEIDRLNDSLNCVNEKNVLSNEILNQKVILNSSLIGYNASLTVLVNRLVQSGEDRDNWRLFAIIELFAVLFLTVYVAKGWSPAFVWDSFINQRFVKTAQFLGRRGKGGGGKPPTSPGGGSGG